MARKRTDEKWDRINSSFEEEEDEQEEEEEEEESLSLCDMPINLLSKDNKPTNQEESKADQTQEDFDFGSNWGGGSVLAESEMCVADEVFFQGQILPLRLSVSSDSPLTGFRHDSRNPSRCNSRSDSLDHRFSGNYSTHTSRSSSTRSYFSSNSSNSTTSTTYKTKPRTIRNQFHTHPSPKPQIRIPSSRDAGGRSRNSSIWDFFRVGLVRTPEIELQNLKQRTNSKKIGSNKNSEITSVSTTNSGVNKIGNHDLKSMKNQRSYFDKNDGAFFSGCKCSADAVESVSSRIVSIKSRSKRNNNESEADVKENLLMMKQKQEKQKQGKQTTAMSNHRTFQWLKELSIEGSGLLDVDDDDNA